MGGEETMDLYCKRCDAVTEHRQARGGSAWCCSACGTPHFARKRNGKAKGENGTRRISKAHMRDLVHPLPVQAEAPDRVGHGEGEDNRLLRLRADAHTRRTVNFWN